MLPAHAYPELHRHPHLAGQYGGAWQDQQTEFATFPGPIVMTSNCIIEPAASYKQRIFTTGPVGWPGVRHLDTYYTEIADQSPSDTVMLTLGCAKYRINHHDYGTIGGIPRLLDVGQCNDAYSAPQIAIALAGAFECEVNDLPLSLFISWFEQKAAAVLLTLLALGIRDIRLGPSLPAFITPAAVDVLVEQFGLMANGDPGEDLANALAGR